ncbi:MAG: hypothetical protein ACO1RT_03390 [Planctomycetaceae bacterium]
MSIASQIRIGQQYCRERLRKWAMGAGRLTAKRLVSIVLSAVGVVLISDVFIEKDEIVQQVVVVTAIVVAVGLIVLHLLNDYILVRSLPYELLLDFYRCKEDASPDASATRAYEQCVRWGDYSRVFEAARIYIEYHLWGIDKNAKPLEDFVNESLQRTTGNGSSFPITIPNLFAITAQEELIRNYFNAVMKADPYSDTRDRFLTELTVQNGYVAYQQLLDGLLTTFDESWERLIQQFVQECDNNRAGKFAKTGFKRSQLYAFYCWLLWGPSVPIGSCTQWRKSHTMPSLALQYGFGDECNSLSVARLVEASKDDQDFDALVQFVASSPFALDVGLTVRPVFIPPDPKTGTQEVQQSLQSLGGAQQGLFRSTAKRRDGTILLDYRQSRWAGGSQVATDPKKYYSAYVWVMFVLVDTRTGRPVFAPPSQTNVPETSAYSQAWHGMFPFFEHGNIADDTSYALFKYQLACKALASISVLIKEPFNRKGDSIKGTQDYRFQYACASDDANCADTLCQSHRDEFDPQWKSTTLIKDHLQRLLGESRDSADPDYGRFKDLQEHVRLGVAESEATYEAWEEQRASFSACHLPDIIHQFYKHLEMADAQ